jgi:DNA-binding NtrC family response regulator
MPAVERPLNILVIDDEEAISFAFRRYFEGRASAVRLASSGAAGLAAYRAAPADVVFLDVRLPDADGLEVLEALRREDPAACVIVMTAYGSLDTVTRAIRGKALDYLVKPIDLERAAELVAQVRAMRGAAQARPAFAGEGDQPLLAGRSAAIQEVYKQIARAAESEATVLIVGQTGTGKERVARAIHVHSHRRHGPFVAVSVGALPESLAESELFGYAKGAFTGADVAKPGHFQAADGGTLLLDEVGEIPPAVQAKLLRFLDTQTIVRLGSVEPARLDVRIVAATNRDLRREIEAGRFREDLYYRLAVVQIEVPALAARREDIPLLARDLLRGLVPAGNVPSVSPEAARLLEAHPWPGNVRELKSALQHAVAVSGGGLILASHLPEAVRSGAALPGTSGRGAPPRQPDAHALLEKYVDLLAGSGPERFRTAMADLERALIRRALKDAGGNHSAAAQRLGMHRNTLRAKVRQYGLDD